MRTATANPIDIRHNRSIFGKSLRSHTATLGDFAADGATATEAKVNLLTSIDTYRTYLRVIGCVDGTVLVITRATTGHMQYTICGAGRAHSSGVLSNTTSESEMLRAARLHAEQSYGGIAYEQ